MFQLNMDCEGPLTQNDNAFELCQEFIPSGGKFFSIVSKYDDFLADVVKKQGYKAGDTLKLVLPFLKAFGVTDETMEKFSERTLVLLPGTEVMLPEINKLLPSFIISTSYRPYIEALCTLTSFPIKNCYYTNVMLDKYKLPGNEEKILKELALEISQMDMIGWPQDAKGRDDLDEKDKASVSRLDEIFWQIIPSMSIGRILDDVNPVGGAEKAKAVEDSVKRTGLGLERVIYAGDSITDSQALEMVKRAKGIAISFNGNRYAMKFAQYAVLSDNTCILYGLAAVSKAEGRDVLSEIPRRDDGALEIEPLMEILGKAKIRDEIMEQIRGSVQEGLLEIYSINQSDFESLVKMSEKVRKEVRGHKVGELG